MGGLAGWLGLVPIAPYEVISGKLTLETASFVASTQSGKINHERAPLPALNTNQPPVRAG
ncbi:uncharacterized protein RSE6_07976 [Rhynchosporium secalis]|uniref:Uncharacterized protein n=1 Tax=Rhynchosporium secalis TaxID=38038 RepID=A0A1E1MEB1_RHYSE|nr:uncharacterized protein RSE6_07976 [Rhynchosporium secalis]